MSEKKTKKKTQVFNSLYGYFCNRPGFLTQSATFTETYGASFAFVILVTIILTLIVQINIWRIIGVSGMRDRISPNKILPGLGYFVAALVALGGLAFNIGNIGGAALGLKCTLELM